MLAIAVPGSKSITQRALVACALSGKPQFLAGALRCDDSLALARLLEGFGHTLEWTSAGLRFTPSDQAPKHVKAHCDAGGTTLRFGACLSVVHNGSITLDARDRLRQRPLKSLMDSLSALGVIVSYLSEPEHAPVLLQGPTRTAHTVPEVVVDSSESSQFVSGLLLVAPLLPHGLRVRTQPDMVSKPYVNLTLNMLRAFEIDAQETEPGVFVVQPGRYNIPENFAIEGDWSSASFVLAAAHIAKTNATVPNVFANSWQGDSRFSQFMKLFTLDSNRNFHLFDTPDLLPPLAALAACTPGTTTFTGVAHARTKECDRVAVLCHSFQKLGLAVQEFADGFSVATNAKIIAERSRAPNTPPIALNPMDDHRMAMCFGLLELFGYPVIIQNKECVSKSFPNFWEVLNLIRSKTP